MESGAVALLRVLRNYLDAASFLNEHAPDMERLTTSFPSTRCPLQGLTNRDAAGSHYARWRLSRDVAQHALHVGSTRGRAANGLPSVQATARVAPCRERLGTGRLDAGVCFARA